MIDCYFFPTPNGRKITIALEELNLPYRLMRVDILKREQFHPSFLSISPNNKIPAIVDHGVDGEPISIFESGAILHYLAEKTGQLMPQDIRGRNQVLQWLMWQVGGLGPMAGQANHFNKYAREQVPYGIERYTAELGRLYRVMDKQLAASDYLCGEYSIADIACYGWAEQAEVGGQPLSQFPHVYRWFNNMSNRPAVQRGMAQGLDLSPAAILSDEEHDSLFASDEQ